MEGVINNDLTGSVTVNIICCMQHYSINVYIFDAGSSKIAVDLVG
jgi:hypothetical protein